MKFIKDTIRTKSGKDFNVIKISFDDKNLLKTLEQAYLKSEHTNDENQNGDTRSRSKKFDKQIEGILGEIAIENYLKKIFTKEETGCAVNVHRYDDVRTDLFKSAENEYDIKIIHDDKEYTVEARASINYKYKMNENTLLYMDTIGSYVNPKKQNEKISDFYIRPLFQLVEPNSDIDLKTISVLDYILDEKIHLYITGGCTSKMMFGEFSKVKPLGQNKTLYQTIPIINGWDMKNLSEKIREIVCKKA